MLKKMLLLSTTVLAAIALSAPAAQATGPDIEGTESYEGFLQFKVLGGGGAGSAFGCEVTVSVWGLGTDEALVEEFDPTTESCEGTGVFAGCVLTDDFSNPPFFATTTTSEDLAVAGLITIRNVYENCALGMTGSHLIFAEATMTPTIFVTANGLRDINTMHVHAITNNGAVTMSGTLHAEFGFAGLWLENTP